MNASAELDGTRVIDAGPLPRAFLAGEVPSIAVEPVNRCPLCSSDGFRQYSVGFDYELLTCRNPWRFVRCEACGHVWLNPRPTVEGLPVIYPPHYYAYRYEQSIRPVAVQAKALLDRSKIRSILRFSDRAPRSFLDVGCGTGRFLRLMEGQGLSRSEIFGLDIDAEALRRPLKEGYRVYHRRVEEATDIPEAGIDLAIMFHVIEHVSDPALVVRNVRRWLSPHGLFAIETPNLSSPDARLFKDRFWGGYHFPRHWHLFTEKTLVELLCRCGFQVHGVRYQTGHSFWMYSLHHRLRYGRWLAGRRLSRFFDPFGSLLFLSFFTALDKVRAFLGRKTSSMLIIAGPGRS